MASLTVLMLVVNAGNFTTLTLFVPDTIVGNPDFALLHGFRQEQATVTRLLQADHQGLCTAISSVPSEKRVWRWDQSIQHVAL